MRQALVRRIQSPRIFCGIAQGNDGLHKLTGGNPAKAPKDHSFQRVAVTIMRLLLCNEGTSPIRVLPTITDQINLGTILDFFDPCIDPLKLRRGGFRL